MYTMLFGTYSTSGMSMGAMEVGITKCYLIIGVAQTHFSPLGKLSKTSPHSLHSKKET